MAAQLLALAEQQRLLRTDGPEAQRFNPRPPGVIQHGGTTEAVLSWLARRPGRWCALHEVVTGTRRPHKTVSWSLYYLRAHGLIDTVPDSARNSRYLRYRVSHQSRSD